MADINLSAAVRSNLSSLQNTASLMAKTQDRLSTGNKVNTALDNPTNFFTASSLNSRAGDLNNLMDSMANGIKTIEAANNGLTAITKNLESMQSTLRQARQDKSFETVSYSVELSDAGTFDDDNDASTTPAAGTHVIGFLGGAGIEDGTTPGDPLEVDITGMTLDAAVAAINGDAGLEGKWEAPHREYLDAGADNIGRRYGNWGPWHYCGHERQDQRQRCSCRSSSSV
jgi:hypothetical protein